MKKCKFVTTDIYQKIYRYTPMCRYKYIERNISIFPIYRYIIAIPKYYSISVTVMCPIASIKAHIVLIESLFITFAHSWCDSSTISTQSFRNSRRHLLTIS